MQDTVISKTVQKRALLALGLGLAAGLGSPTLAQAQAPAAWPSKNIRIVVPYAAGGPADLVSGQVTAMFSSYPSLQGLVDTGLLRVLAATAPSQSPATRALPLMSATLPGYEYTTWYAMYAPLATPTALVQRIEQALSRAIKQPQLVAKIEAAGTELHAGTAQEVLAWTQRDTDKWSRVIKEAQIAID